MAKKKQKNAGKTPAVQTSKGAAEESAAGGRSSEGSPNQAGANPPVSINPKTPAGADVEGATGRPNKEDEKRGARLRPASPGQAGSEETKEAGGQDARAPGPPASFNAAAAKWHRHRIHGERGPVVEIAGSDVPVYIRSAHGILLCDEGCLIGRYPERPDELFVVSETDFAAVAYTGQPGVNVVDERLPA